METKETIKEMLLLCCRKFYDIEGTREADQAVKMVFDHWPGNTHQEQVLIKVVVLNSLYNTALYAVEVVEMAKHIVKQGVDSKFSQGDPTVVEDIRKGHEISRGKTNKEWNFYSFATKYCHWHVPSRYVMYDTNLDKALRELNKLLEFCRPFSSRELGQYSTLKEVIDSLAATLTLTSWDYKTLDQALWVYGRYLKNSLPDNIKTQLDTLAKAVSEK